MNLCRRVLFGVILGQSISAWSAEILTCRITPTAIVQDPKLDELDKTKLHMHHLQGGLTAISAKDQMPQICDEILTNTSQIKVFSYSYRDLEDYCSEVTDLDESRKLQVLVTNQDHGVYFLTFKVAIQNEDCNPDLSEEENNKLLKETVRILSVNYLKASMASEN
jgi:hypothetical protein